ncbi:MAG: heme exporter protein CcmB, partial [Thermomicrobium sp.]|nr:heme exporter protein CcmB [Thermomicrobium sp.]
GLLLSPVSRRVIFAARFLTMLLFVAVVAILGLVVMAALFALPVFRFGILTTVILGIVGLCTLGTLFSVMTAQARGRQVLLPALLFPLAVPVVIGAVRATTLELAGFSDESGPWKQLLAGFALLYIGIGFATFTTVAEE